MLKCIFRSVNLVTELLLCVNNFRIGIYCMSLSGPVLATYSKYDKCALNEIVSGYFPALLSYVPFNLSFTVKKAV
jgi:hypothetical protein